ncbi:hypothetical protein HPB52_013945 [Rhipicephalus sanguineus]|uniref:Tick transposon n=1 Tax=Rhipicephalus sanguineus TaxID=34632 RepID=A0A9D4SU27_RHISA|nr:hypothetical protein HPB52_013945 [Rhipicephalus sanguineus]
MARARSLHKRYASSTPVAYVDAAEYSHRPAFAVAVSDNAHKLLCCATFDRVAQPIEAEEAAIALAIAHTQAEYIFSDSKTAIRNFAMRRIHAPAYRILQFVPPPKRIITILWVPAHCGHPGNTAAMSKPELSSTGQWTPINRCPRLSKSFGADSKRAL